MALLQDLRYGARMFAKSPGFTAIAVIALALGIGANTAIFSIVDGVLLRPLPYGEPDRLMMISHNFTRVDVTGVYASGPEFFDYRNRNRVFADVAAFAPGSVNLTAGGEPERVAIGNVSAGFFRAMGVEPSLGRAFLDEEDMPGKGDVIILSNGLWRRRFGGDAGIIGRKVPVEGNSYTVVGVMPPGFDFPEKSEIWSPLGLDPAQNEPEQRAQRYFGVIARARPGITLEAARADIRRVGSDMIATYPKNYPQSMGFETAVDSLEDLVVGGVRPALLVLLGAVGCVLLIACANVANLLLARAVARQREIAIRIAMGAGRRRLVRQLLTESLLLSGAGGLVGLLLALWGTDLLKAVNPDSLPRIENVTINIEVLLFTLGIAIVASIIFGLVPALRVSRVRLNETLKEGGRAGAGGRTKSAGHALVVAEVALATMLLVGGVLMLKSFAALLSVSPGFDPEKVVTMGLSLPAAKYAGWPGSVALYDDLLARVKRIPGVTEAAVISHLPVSGQWTDRSFGIEGRPPEPGEPMRVGEWRVASPDYFKAMGIPLLQGRAFTDLDREGKGEVVIINQSLARKHWPNGDAIGKGIVFFPPAGDPRRTIIGVVGDIRHFGLDQDVRPEMYTPYAQTEYGGLSLVARTAGDPSAAIGSIRREARELEPDLALANIVTMEELLSRSVASRRLNMLLFGIFGGVALLLATVGIYGVISYTVSQRTHEIGIRVALGASRRDLVRMILREGAILAGVGVLLGIGGAFAATRLMESFLFGVSTSDPIVYVGVALLLMAVALLACYVPARRATGVDPIVALRYE